MNANSIQQYYTLHHHLPSLLSAKIAVAICRSGRNEHSTHVKSPPPRTSLKGEKDRGEEGGDDAEERREEGTARASRGGGGILDLDMDHAGPASPVYYIPSCCSDGTISFEDYVCGFCRACRASQAQM